MRALQGATLIASIRHELSLAARGVKCVRKLAGRATNNQACNL